MLRSRLPILSEIKRHAGSDSLAQAASREVNSSESRNRLVISVGTLPELLSLREKVLESVGYTVITAPPPEAVSMVRKGECGVLLLCYSISEKWREQLVQDYRKHCPEGRIVAITNAPVVKLQKKWMYSFMALKVLKFSSKLFEARISSDELWLVGQSIASSITQIVAASHSHNGWANIIAQRLCQIKKLGVKAGLSVCADGTFQNLYPAQLPISVRWIAQYTTAPPGCR